MSTRAHEMGVKVRRDENGRKWGVREMKSSVSRQTRPSLCPSLRPMRAKLTCKDGSQRYKDKLREPTPKKSKHTTTDNGRTLMLTHTHRQTDNTHTLAHKRCTCPINFRFMIPWGILVLDMDT